MPSDLTPNDTVSPCFGGENIMLEWKWGETNTYDIDNIISDIGEISELCENRRHHMELVKSMDISGKRILFLCETRCSF